MIDVLKYQILINVLKKITIKIMFLLEEKELIAMVMIAYALD
jgi:hypothetical protein